MTVIAHNPIMPGFYPDPSICAVGEDFYMVHSSFSYFPGLPVMHSKDLAHWEQIGNVMDRESQLPLKESGISRGLFAPTIRYHEGVYYVICTNVSYGGNYIVTAISPEGPWSEPHYIEGAGGIDPSLFFDEDGKCYYIGTHPNPAGCLYDGDWYIWIQELDLTTMKLVGEPKDVWNGAMKNIIWPEGPHLYKRGDYYYILHAEGGTGPNHAVTVCRSKSIWGPYENNFCNPILTHRHLGWAYPVKYVGHADLVETVAGEWYMVMLAVRPQEGYTTMGRETFLAKVVWENDWPVVNPGVGILTDTVEINLPEWNPMTDTTSHTYRSQGKNCEPGSSRCYDFTGVQELGDEFLTLRHAKDEKFRLAKEGLYLGFTSDTLKEMGAPAYLAIRQQHHNFVVTAALSLKALSEEKRAGIALVQNEQYQLRVEVSDTKAEVILCEKGVDARKGMMTLNADEVKIILHVQDLKATIDILEKGTERTLVNNVDIHALSTEVAGGFVGCTVGMFAVTDEEAAQESALFKSFSYQGN
ncbi:MAG: glycoside hydrolase family 43 protein [Lachnospiraceae bacterium]|nr:glycoside hydrolase family 43 protein [Lachnospiraceae bacterium]